MRVLVQKARKTLATPPAVQPVLPTFEQAARATRRTTRIHTLKTPRGAKTTRKPS